MSRHGSGDPTPPATAPRPRLLAQVLVADCEAAGPVDRAPGWKVKDVAPAPGSVPVPPALLAPVLAAGRTPVPATARAGARRPQDVATVLRNHRLPGGAMLLLNVSDCGPGRTGRPEHIAHGLVHDGPLTAPDGRLRRPVELIDSPLWLRPVGRGPVEAAAVRGRPFDLPTGPVDLDDVTGPAFLTDPAVPRRRALLPVLLEAFRRAQDSDRSLVLVVPNAGETVGWLAVLSCVLDPFTAGRLRFGIDEDVRAPGAVARWDHQVAGVTATAAEQASGALAAWVLAQGPRFVVVDTLRPPPVVDGAWRSPDGTTVRASPWTSVAERVLTATGGPTRDAPHPAGEVRRTLDHLTHDAPALVAAGPAWALAVAAVLAGPGVARPGDLVRAVLRYWPRAAPAGALDPELVDRLRALVAAHAAGAALPDLSPGVPAAVADPVIDALCRRALADAGRAAQPPPVLPRALSSPAVESLAADLPDLVGWLGATPAVLRGPALVRVWALAAAAGVDATAIGTALRPFAGPVADRIVDPAFDPVAARWPVPAAGLWRTVLGDAVTRALRGGGSGSLVSAATHRWVEPALADQDRPEVAVRTRHFGLTPYGWQRAAWAAQGSDDPWLAGVAAVGRIDAMSREGRLPLAECATFALREAFATAALRPDVATVLLADVPDGEPDTLVAIAVFALSTSDFGPDHVALARAVWERLVAAGQSDRRDTGEIYLHLVVDSLLVGPPADAGVAAVTDAAEYVLDAVLPLLESADVRQRAEQALVGWAFRIPVAVLREGTHRPERGDGYGAALTDRFGRLGLDPPRLDAALAAVLRRNDDDDVRRILANLLVRVGLVCFENPVSDRDEPFEAYLSETVDRHVPRFVAETVSAWVAGRGRGEVEVLGLAVDDVLDELGAIGWDIHRGWLDEDRDELFAMLSSRATKGRRRNRR